MRSRWGGVASRNRAGMRAGKGVASMVTYDGLFQYTIVLLTLIFVILALIKRKK